MDDTAPPPQLTALPPSAPPVLPPARGSLRQLALQGLRALFLLRVRWDRISATPALLAVLFMLVIGLASAVERLHYAAGATFEWQPLLQRYSSLLFVVWACYVMRERRSDSAPPARARSAADLLAIYFVMELSLSLLIGAAHLLKVDLSRMATSDLWKVLLAIAVWFNAATLLMLLRGGSRDIGRRVQAVYAIGATVIIFVFIPRPSLWSAAPTATTASVANAPAAEVPAASPDSEDEELAPIRFDQEAIERQAPLLAEKLAALAPQRPGVPDMYTITFAPYEGEEVFRRESRVVNEVMAGRFDAAGRQLTLINHAEEVDRAIWATPLNLRRAIAGVARKMNPAEDVLMIHMTSHGAADGELAANFWPLDVAPVMPSELKQWLDDAGIRYRVLSISACFSGSWIAPLAGDSTLVMTAADADHTSYGCGKKSALTFFGRAMYDEQLRTETLSFVQAHAAARKIIARREQEAGKDDGYSNPQIKAGKDILPYLERMTTRLRAN